MTGRCAGFSAEQLNTLDALVREAPDVALNVFDDKQAISPIFDKRKWTKASDWPKHQARFPLGLGRDGYWEV